ncbi:hypothetical protein ACKWTF_000132 [Chironomus riparius]
MNLKFVLFFALIFWTSQAVLSVPLNDFRLFMPRSNLAMLETEELVLGDPIDAFDEEISLEDIADLILQQERCKYCFFCCLK